jgi:hypothetical protein
MREAQNNEPLRVVNPATSEAFVLLPAEVYERVKSAILEEFDPREAYPMIDRIMAEDDANDPHLAAYQNYRRGNQP